MPTNRFHCPRVSFSQFRCKPHPQSLSEACPLFAGAPRTVVGGGTLRLAAGGNSSGTNKIAYDKISTSKTKQSERPSMANSMLRRSSPQSETRLKGDLHVAVSTCHKTHESEKSPLPASPSSNPLVAVATAHSCARFTLPNQRAPTRRLYRCSDRELQSISLLLRRIRRHHRVLYCERRAKRRRFAVLLRGVGNAGTGEPR